MPTWPVSLFSLWPTLRPFWKRLLASTGGVPVTVAPEGHSLPVCGISDPRLLSFRTAVPLLPGSQARTISLSLPMGMAASSRQLPGHSVARVFTSLSGSRTYPACVFLHFLHLQLPGHNRLLWPCPKSLRPGFRWRSVLSSSVHTGCPCPGLGMGSAWGQLCFRGLSNHAWSFVALPLGGLSGNDIPSVTFQLLLIESPSLAPACGLLGSGSGCKPSSPAVGTVAPPGSRVLPCAAGSHREVVRLPPPSRDLVGVFCGSRVGPGVPSCPKGRGQRPMIGGATPGRVRVHGENTLAAGRRDHGCTLQRRAR